MQQGFGHYDDAMEDAEVNRSGTREKLAVNATDAAIRWIEDDAQERFFLWLH